MPDLDGRIPPVAVPELPWKQRFKKGERVRVTHGAGLVYLRGTHGTVKEHMGPEKEPHPVCVQIDGRAALSYLSPGELRRLP